MERLRDAYLDPRGSIAPREASLQELLKGNI